MSDTTNMQKLLREAGDRRDWDECDRLDSLQPAAPEAISNLITDAQIEAWQKAKAEQIRLGRQATIKKLEALADELGYVIVAIPQQVEIAPGVVGFGAVWGVAEKAK